ncbi:head processing protein [Yersinia ruckeri]|uniref:head processing protein n=1 Tax=Yersinia ruckeri TaxID=29486 RepID=UPI0020C0318A|nr:head processing protein [Yersinia ruckeri]EKN4689530.1 head processing protein [Yersinia ruckeri]MCK8586354.1 head processing protein [Yersinia ruckeri]MCW6615596.1 head processing protein [Yersinia ruckeri]
MKNLLTVTDRFSVIDCIRKHTPQNNRNYMLSSIKASLNSKETKEKMALGELFGYYGHERREEHYKRTGSLVLPQTSVLMVDGKPVVLDNVPSNRTVSASIDDSGIVTHSQEILDTDTGRIVQAMEKSKAGGWSWVTGGADTTWKSVVRKYYGCDYVTTPNYISLDREVMMSESVNERKDHIVKSFLECGYSETAAVDLSEHFEKMREQEMMVESVNRLQTAEGELLILSGRLLELTEKLEEQDSMLEAANNSKALRQNRLATAIDKLPLFLTEEQRNAMLRMETEDDLQVVEAIFESVGGVGISGLPLGSNRSGYQPAPAKRSNPAHPLNKAPIISLRSPKPPKFSA